MKNSPSFSRPSDLFAYIPASTELDVQQLFEKIGFDVTGSSSQPFAGSAQRKLLYFDEHLSVYGVLRLSGQADEKLRSYIGSLTPSLVIHAVGHRATSGHGEEANRDQAPLREHLLSQDFSEGEEPLIIFQGTDSASDDGSDDQAAKIIYAIWKFDVFLKRPRTRLQNPYLVFSISASQSKAASLEQSDLDDEYMESIVPDGPNLLGSFIGDPILGPLRPRLSSSKVSHTPSNKASATEPSRPLSCRFKPFIPVVSAVSSRLRFISQDPSNGSLSMICALDFAVSPFTSCNISLEKIELSLTSGRIIPLTDPDQVGGLPLICQSRDELTFIYRLTQPIGRQTQSQDEPDSYPLEVVIETAALVAEDCKPHIYTKWNTPVTFESKLESMRNTLRADEQSLQSQRSPPIFKPDSIPAMQSPKVQQGVDEPIEFGLLITVTGPPTVKLGEPYQWEIFAVNRSQRHIRMALVAIVKRRRVEGKKLPPRPVSTGGSARPDDTADAVVDENIVYAMQKNAHIEMTDLICLSTDVRIGPLLPDACHAATLKFMPLKVGVLQVEALRIVDLTTQETVDVRELPVSVCKE